MSTCTQVVSNDNGVLFEHIILPVTHIAEYQTIFIKQVRTRGYISKYIACV